MPATQNSALKLSFFLLGVALPVVGFLVWRSCARGATNEKAHLDQLQEKAVEDSFPASDPPSTW